MRPFHLVKTQIIKGAHKLDIAGLFCHCSKIKRVIGFVKTSMPDILAAL